MNRAGAFILLASACACHKHEDAIVHAETPVETTVAATSPAPSATASASAAPEIAAPPEVEDGGKSGGIGLGPIGTIGRGMTGTHIGNNQIHSPTVRQGTTTVVGRLPPEVVQRIVRQNFGRFRWCYENGLRKDPSLAGKVVTKFVIDTKGAVTTTTRDASTTMADATVVSCVMSAISNLSFPEPEGGIVVVTYPLTFAPSD